jgi:ribosomal protein S18 acetylase RimI-like enzyme
MEMAGFNLREAFPKLDLDNLIYVEASRLAVLPDFRGADISEKLLTKSTEYFINQVRGHVCFGYSTLANAKSFRRLFSRKLGYNFINRFDIKSVLPSSGDDLFLWAIDFTNDPNVIEQLKSSNISADTENYSPEFA